jgi:L-ascorbate metabolism protein UlaG (beta-lactamase superfamily)
MKNTVYIILSFLLYILVASTGLCYAGVTSPSLKYLGNAFVKITTTEGRVIYIDPYAINQSDSADVVLITHEHECHNDLSRIVQKIDCEVIRTANAIQSGVYQSFTIGTIKVTAVPAYNAYHPKSDGVGFVVEFDSIKVYHAGGTENIPEMVNLASQKIDYALLPMTPGPEKLTQAAAIIHARYDIPVHTIVSLSLAYDAALTARFTSPHKFVVLPGETIELTQDQTSHLGKILRVPQEYPTIQTAIDAAKNSDTVLVSEGTYYENIRYRGKGIVVTSKYFMTQDWQTVNNTIIDGSTCVNKDSASTVQFLNNEDSTSVLDGFTITGGTGIRWMFGSTAGVEGGGIILSYSSAIIKNNIVSHNITRSSAGDISGGGGGISSMYGNPTIYNNVISSNTSGYAGGIVLNWSKGIVRNNIIIHNTTIGQWGGGGIMLWQTPQSGGIAENNTIINNTSSTTGGGIEISVADATTIPIIRNNIVWGNRQALGGQVNDPQYLTGYNDVEDYSSGTNISAFPHLLDKSFLLSPTSSCIDAGDPAVAYHDIEDSGNPSAAMPPSKGTLRNDMGAFGGVFTKTLPSIDIGDIHASSNAISITCPVGQQKTSGVELLNLSSKSITIDSVTLTENALFTFNKSFTGQVFDLLVSDSMNVTFRPTRRANFYDTIKVFHTITDIINPFKIVITASSNSTPYLNKPIPMQTGYAGQLFTFQIPDSTFLDNDIEDSLIYQVSGIPAWLSFNPQTRTFQGTPTQTTSRVPLMIMLIAKDTLQASASTYVRITILPATGIDDAQSRPLTNRLDQNYPNPFNPSTTIHFQVPTSSQVNVKVFDVLGREIVTLVNEHKNPGVYSVQWNADRVPSGVYFYRLEVYQRSGEQVTSFIDTKRLIVLK